MAALLSAPGIGLSPDSVVYLGGARGLLRGDGFADLGPAGAPSPITHFPPLYSAALALLGLSGIDPSQAARWLGCALFAANTFLVGLIVLRETRSRAAALLAAVFASVSVPLWQVHSMAWSEPLFFLFGLLAMLQLGAGGRDRRHAAWLLAAAAAAAAGLTRYAGVVWIAAGGAVLLAPRGLRRPWEPARAAPFAAVAALPAALWALRNAITADSVANRSLVFHPPGAADWLRARRALAGWIWPGATDGSSLWLLPSALALFSLLVLAARRDRQANEGDMPCLGADAVAGVFGVFYAAFLVVSRTWFDAHILFDTRMLSPLHLCALLGFASFLGRTAVAVSVRRAAAAVAALLVLSHLSFGIPWGLRVAAEGQGFAAAVWRESAIVASVRRLPPEVTVFSNGHDVIGALAGRQTAPLPARVDPITRRPRPEFDAEIEALSRRLGEGDGRVVYVRRVTWRWYLPDEAELVERLRLHAVEEAQDGAIYAARAGPSR